MKTAAVGIEWGMNKLAEKFGVTPETISVIARNKFWRHLEG